MADAAASGDCQFGDLVDRIGARGFGPLLIFCAAIVMLPTGAIPGIPAVVGGAMIVLGIQVLWGSSKPWLPKRLRRLALSDDKLNRAIAYGRPTARFLGAFVRPRADILANGMVARRVAGLAIVASGLVLIPLGFIPLVPFFVSIPAIIVGMAMTARDGVAMSFGLFLFVLPAWIIYRSVGSEVAMLLS